MPDPLAGAPIAVQRLPRDRRGLLIPFAVFTPPGGEPDFRVLDQQKVDRCIRDRLCGICGDPIGHWLWLIGGPSCAESRAFKDPPMHETCAAYSALVCPFVSGDATLYSNRELPEQTAELMVHTDPAQADHVRRPPIMFLFKTRRVTRIQHGLDVYLRAAPFAQVVPIAPRSLR